MFEGGLQPKTASVAVQGVRRSICARTMPSRNSRALRGKSSDRNRTWSDLSRNSTWLPRSVLSQSAGSEGSGRPLDRRNETSGKATPFFTDTALARNVFSSPSTSNICRWGIKRLAIKLVARATAAIHSPNSSLSSEIIAIIRQLSWMASRSPHFVLPRQHAVGILFFFFVQPDHNLRRGPTAVAEFDRCQDTKRITFFDRRTCLRRAERRCDRSHVSWQRRPFSQKLFQAGWRHSGQCRNHLGRRNQDIDLRQTAEDCHERQGAIDERRRQPENQSKFVHMRKWCLSWRISKTRSAVERHLVLGWTGLRRCPPPDNAVGIAPGILLIGTKTGKQICQQFLRSQVEIDEGGLRHEGDENFCFVQSIVK